LFEILLIDNHDDDPAILKDLDLLKRSVAASSFSADALSRKQNTEPRFDGIQYPTEFRHGSEVSRN